MSEKTIAHVDATVRYKKVDGTLTLTTNRISWVSLQGGGKTFQCLYSEIKAQRISPESSSKVQLQILLHSEISSNFQFVNPSGRATQLNERNKIKDLLAELIPAHRGKANKDLEEKNKLFKENTDLYQLYKDLVVTGIIKSEEFWESHKATSKGTADHQNVGIASGLLAELKPDMHGCNELRFNLTADSIDAVFKMYPAVKKKYLSTVPDEMTEKEFWTEFFQSQHFHRDRIPKNKTSSKDIFGELAKKDEQDQLTQVVLDFSDPLIDFTPACPNTEEGYGTTAGKRVSVNEPLIKHFNHQSLMVLQNIQKRSANHEDGIQSKKKRIREAVELVDLEEESTASAPVLKILDTDKFSHIASIGQHNGHANGNCAKLKPFCERVSAWQPNLTQVLSNDSAKAVISELAPGGKFMTSHRRSSSIENVPPHVHVELRKSYLALNELLRHFWSCFPIRTPQLEEKVRRMAVSLDKFRTTKLANFTCSLSSQNNQLGNHLHEMINVALNKYNSWEDRRNRSTKT